MKTFTFKTVYSILFSIVSICVYAQSSLVIDVKEHGTLEALIGETKYTLKELKLTGEINLYDFDIIHQCASRGILEKVDFSEVKLPNNEIPDKAFLKTESGQAWSLVLKSVILPANLHRIGYAAFAGCYYMESIQMPETLSVLEADVFYECRNLKNIIIPAGITELKNTTFYQCESLESVHLPDNVTKIGYSVFYACHNLRSINLPESLDTIGALAFGLNFELETITIPQNVIEVGESGFYNCKKLKSIKLSPNMKEIRKSTFMWVPELKEIDIPEGIEKIEENAFFWDYELTKVTFPSSLAYIGEGAFDNCNLDTIVLPENLNFIGASAFAMCKNMKCIYSMSHTPPQLGEIIPSFHAQPAFGEIPKDICILYVPKGAGNLYKNAEGWNEFVNIIETDNFPSSYEVPLIPNCELTSSEGTIIVSNLTNKPLSVRIYNMNGSLVHEEKVLGTHTIAVLSGIYLVKVGNRTDKIVVK